jgi:hypothetical protein
MFAVDCVTLIMIRYPILFFLVFSLLACQQDNGVLTTICKLPKEVKECSGIINDARHELLWAIADSGNQNVVYGLTNKGRIAKTITLSNVANIDWEDITSDPAGNLYIGDFGNNENTRTDLAIYKVPATALESSTVNVTTKISFAYPEQKEFPPKKKGLFYDCEAFFEHKGYFYLFTKNRSKGFDGTTFMYQVPNQSGFHQAKLLGKFITCADYQHCAITSVAISPDASKIVLLSHSKVWLLDHFKDNKFLNGAVSELDLNHFSQKEAVCFKDDKTLLIADEKTKKTGGKVYEVTLSSLKSKP